MILSRIYSALCLGGNVIVSHHEMEIIIVIIIVFLSVSNISHNKAFARVIRRKCGADGSDHCSIYVILLTFNVHLCVPHLEVQLTANVHEINVMVFTFRIRETQYLTFERT
jgi:hypothetical protein